MGFSLRLRSALLASALALAPLIAATAHPDDWPQWRGPNRDGVWRETGILETIPPDGLKTLWRVRIGAGYSAPVVAHGRVFVTDRQLQPDVERVLCFEEQTGSPLWAYSYPCDYENMDCGNGPRAAPTVHEGKVYTLGARGNLFCFDAATGRVLWQKDLVKECEARLPRWGVSAAPLVEGGLLLVVAGGQPEACVMAFEKNTGKRVWESLRDRPAYSDPLGIDSGGKRQVIVRTQDAVNSLDPATGKAYWQVPWKTSDACNVIGSPVVHGDLLVFLSGWRQGSKMLKLDPAKPAVSVLWESRTSPDATFSTPLFLDDRHFCVVNTIGEFCCVDATSGKEIWSTREPTSRLTWGNNGHLTPNGDRVFFFNHKGHLILTKLTPEGYHEIGRCLLVEPTAGTRAERPVTWAHPAYANKHVFARNDRELVCASLAAEQIPSTQAKKPNLVAEPQVLTSSAGPQEAFALAFSPDGKMLALGTDRGTVKLLELSTGKELPSPPKCSYQIHSVAFSPDGKLLASAGGNEFQSKAG